MRTLKNTCITIKNIPCEAVALVLWELFFGQRKNTGEKCPQNRVTALQAIKKNFISFFLLSGKRGHGKRGQAYKKLLRGEWFTM